MIKMPSLLALRLLSIAARSASPSWRTALGLACNRWRDGGAVRPALVDGIDDSVLTAAVQSTHGAMRITAPQTPALSLLRSAISLREKLDHTPDDWVDPSRAAFVGGHCGH